MSEDLVRDLYTTIDELEEDNSTKEIIIQAFERSFDIGRDELMKDYIVRESSNE